MLDAGEGRTRVLAACGVMSGVGFGLAILADGAVSLGVPACWSGLR